MTTGKSSAATVPSQFSKLDVLMALDPTARLSRMSAEFTALARSDAMIMTAYLRSIALDAHTLRNSCHLEFTRSLLACWLALSHEDAFVIASAYTSVIQGLPVAVDRRRTPFVRSALRSFGSEQRSRLDFLILEPSSIANRLTEGGDSECASATEAFAVWPYTGELR